MGRSKLLSLLFSSLVFMGFPSNFAFAAKDDSQGATQTQAQEAIKNAQQQLNGIPTQRTAQEVKNAGDSCVRSLEDGKNACVESKSPHIAQMAPVLGAAMSAMAGAAGSAEKCQVMQQAGQALSSLQGNYNSSCEEKKVACSKACGSASEKAAEAISISCRAEALEKSGQIESAAIPMIELCVNAAKANQNAISGDGMNACEDLQANADAGKGNAGDLAKGLGNSTQCQQDTADCVKDPKNPKCPKVVDCNNPVDAKTEPKCICELNPRSKGCGGSTQYTKTNPNGTNKQTGADEPTGTDGSPAGPSDMPVADQPAGNSLPGASAGGDGGGLSGQGADSTAGEKAAKKMEMFGGEYAGGGGGRPGSTDPYGKYAEYLPKNKKGDRKAASDASQLTASHGLTNWEKISARYKDNKQTLLGDMFGNTVQLQDQKLKLKQVGQ